MNVTLYQAATELAAALDQIDPETGELPAEYGTARELVARLYWALLRDISDQAWVDGKQYSSEAWHAYFAGQYIGREETPGGGSIAISTTTLSVNEFADYVTRIQAYAATELGIET
jgi:hypothetical protein